MPRKRYQTVALGGTFDHFHEGHKKFLDDSAALAEKLLIGITTEKLTQHKPYAHLIEPIRVRMRAVGNYCKRQGYRVELVELTDSYGPTVLSETAVQALSVTTATVKGADKINEIRRSMKLPELPVHVSTLKMAEDGQPIASTRIRSGEISRVGVVYSQILMSNNIFTNKQRTAFSAPQGSLVSHPEHVSKDKTIVVGDVCLSYFITEQLPYNVGIFDGMTKRKENVPSTLTNLPVTKVENPAGTISAQAVEILQNSLQSDTQTHIKVQGEEDLLTVAAVLLASLGSIVYYGQPDVGMVEVLVSETSKEKFVRNLTH